MTADKPAPLPSPPRVLVWVIVIAMVVVGVSVLGTLALAWQTFALAKATRKVVDESSDELEELKAQRGLLERQANGIAAQAKAIMEGPNVKVARPALISKCRGLERTGRIGSVHG